MADREMNDREKLVYQAKLAEQAERYDEMAQYMKKVAEMPDPLIVDERNLLSVAYKNAVGARRASWRIINSVEQKEQSKPNPSAQRIKLAHEYRVKIESELFSTCQEILDILQSLLVPRTTQAESQVFFLKMSGDYFRYISEFSVSERSEHADKANEAYMKASDIANKDLPPTHPIRLGLALNYSVFHYEIMGNSETACGMAQKAFDLAISELDSLSDDSYKDATLIMQLLRDNLTLWTTDPSTEGEPIAKQ